MTVGNRSGDSINRTVEVITYNPIPLTSLAVSSDNTINNNYARAGDTITITLEIDSIDITSIFGLIAGSEEFNTSINGNDATLTKILKQSDENGELEFELQARNSSGYTAIITNEHLTGAPIIIDTIPPTLVLNGENNTSFPSGTPYVDTVGVWSTVMNWIILDSIGSFTETISFRCNWIYTYQLLQGISFHPVYLQALEIR